MLHWVFGARHPVADEASAAPEADGGDALPATVRVPAVLPGTMGLLTAGMRPVTEVRQMTARLPAWRDHRLSGKQFTLIDPEPPLIFRAATETRNTTEFLRRRGAAELLWPADQRPRGEPPDGVPPGVPGSPVAQPRRRGNRSRTRREPSADAPEWAREPRVTSHVQGLPDRTADASADPAGADSSPPDTGNRVVVPLFRVRPTAPMAAAGAAGTGATVIELRPRAGKFRTDQVSRITTPAPGRLSRTPAIGMAAGANGGVPDGLLADEGMSSG
ncbi:hypothetical protein [Streptomyces sp. NPDC002537]